MKNKTKIKFGGEELGEEEKEAWPTWSHLQSRQLYPGTPGREKITKEVSVGIMRQDRLDKPGPVAVQDRAVIASPHHICLHSNGSNKGTAPRCLGGWVAAGSPM